MAGVFISYRRNDNDVAAGRLADDLSKIFGREAIFRDVDTLEAGEDYTKALDHALDSCAALIAVIGSRWSNITDDAGHRRLDDTKDWVRIEISRALERGVRVIPVLISATMPRETDVPADLQPLLQRQAFELSDRHWRQDIELLAQALEKVPTIAKRVSAPDWPVSVVTRRHMLAASTGLLILAIAASLGWWYWHARVAVGSVDLSQWVRIRDSGTEGAVAGLALVTAMEASFAQQRRPVTLSARYLYEKAKRLDRFGPKTEGTDMAAVLYVAETFGAPPEDRWPYFAGSRDLPKGVTWEKMDEAAGQFRARAFRLSRYEDIPQHLKQGRPVVAEIKVTDAWMSDEAAKTGLIKLGVKETLMGGHAVVIVGFDLADSSIKFANSWGVGWGANGFGKMSVKDAQNALVAMWAIDVPPKEP
jgi:TIR domain/Papain family cysteine protease